MYYNRCKKCGKQIEGMSKLCGFCQMTALFDNVQHPTEITYKLHTTCSVYSIILGFFCWSMIFYIPNFSALIGFAIVGILLGIGGIVTAKKAKANIGLSIAGITVSLIYLLAKGLIT